ncbi:MAG TPA: hypothetical protein P5084_02655 [Paludibacter sp.]|nr:hypothetical protein [Paludibacter sp.]
MSQENQVSITIPAEALADVFTKMNALSAVLVNYLLFNLTPSDRLEINKMGDKTLAFVQKALEYAENNPSLVPVYLDITEAKKDFALSRDLNNILKQVSTLQRAIEDTMMVSGSEAYNAALVFYNSVKGASRVNVPGSEAVYNDLHQRFAVKLKKTEAK